MISPCFSLVSHEFLHDFPMVFPTQSGGLQGRWDGIRGFYRRPCPGRTGEAEQWDVGCGTCAVEVTKSPKISQNDGTTWDTYIHLHDLSEKHMMCYTILCLIYMMQSG